MKTVASPFPPPIMHHSPVRLISPLPPPLLYSCSMYRILFAFGFLSSFRSSENIQHTLLSPSLIFLILPPLWITYKDYFQAILESERGKLPRLTIRRHSTYRKRRLSIIQEYFCWYNPSTTISWIKSLRGRWEGNNGGYKGQERKHSRKYRMRLLATWIAADASASHQPTSFHVGSGLLAFSFLSFNFPCSFLLHLHRLCVMIEPTKRLINSPLHAQKSVS